MSGPAMYRHFANKEAILTTLLVDISESLLVGGRQRVEGTHGWDAIVALVDWHVSFALDNPTLIILHSRDLDALAPSEQRRVRHLQRLYVDIWVEAIKLVALNMDDSTALATAHAVFGLINSTPHSAHLNRDNMSLLLRNMTLAAICGSYDATIQAPV